MVKESHKAGPRILTNPNISFTESPENMGKRIHFIKSKYNSTRYRPAFEFLLMQFFVFSHGVIFCHDTNRSHSSHGIKVYPCFCQQSLYYISHPLYIYTLVKFLKRHFKMYYIGENWIFFFNFNTDSRINLCSRT